MNASIGFGSLWKSWGMVGNGGEWWAASAVAATTNLLLRFDRWLCQTDVVCDPAMVSRLLSTL